MVSLSKNNAKLFNGEHIARCLGIWPLYDHLLIQQLLVCFNQTFSKSRLLPGIGIIQSVLKSVFN